MAEDFPVVLLVEGNPESRKVTAEYLTSQGFEVIETSTHEKAMEIWASGKPDIMMTDHSGAGLSGIELLEKMKETSPEDRAVRGLLTTPALLSVSEKVRLCAIPKTVILTKPFQMRVLRNKLLELMGKPPLFSIPPGAGLDEDLILLYQIEPLQMEGQIIDTSLSNLFHAIFIEQFTGVLHLETDEGSKRIYFHNGLPVFAESDIVNETLGAFLVHKGIITQEQNTEVFGTLRTTGMKQGEILVQKGLISPHDLFSHLEAHIMEKVRSAFDLVDAAFHLTPGDEWLGCIIPARIPSGRLIIDGIRRSVPADQIRSELLLDERDVPFFLPNQIYMDEQLRLTTSETRIKRLMEKRTPLGKLLSTSNEQRRDDVQLLYAFYQMQIIGIDKRGLQGEAPKDAPQVKLSVQPKAKEAPKPPSSVPPGDRPKSEPPTHPEAEQLMAQYLKVRDADYYTLLGIPQTASAKDIENAYKKALIQYHPDKVRRLGSQPLLEKVTEVYIRIQDAIKTLSNPTLRIKYDERLLSGCPINPASSLPSEERKRVFAKELSQQQAAGAPKPVSRPPVDGMDKMPHWQLFSKGRHFMEIEKFDEAKTCFKLANAKAHSPKYRAFEAWAMFMQSPKENIEKAEEILGEIREKNSEDAMTWYVSGMIASSLNNYDGAISAFEKAVQIDPNFVDAARQLRHTLHLQKTTKKEMKISINMDLGDLFKRFKKR